MTVARIVLILIILVGGTVLFSNAPKSNALCEGCNVILISIDTLGAKHTSVYDPSLQTTPFLKRLADERGVVFERAYAQAPWTLPSHTAMLTGLYPWDLGVWEGLDALPTSVTTLAERFQKNGYETALFSNGAFVQPEWGLDQGFEHIGRSLAESTWDDLPGLFQEGSAWAVDTAESGAPFFLMLRTFAVHDPYVVPGKDSITIHNIVDVNLRPEGPSNADAERFRTAYHEGVTVADAALEKLFDDLSSAGLAHNTVVLITSDHGEEFGEHGAVGLHSIALYEESIHVPFVLIIPGRESARVGATVEIRSIPATLLEIVGIPTKDSSLGASVVPLLTGKANENHIVLSRTKFSRLGHLKTIEQSYAALVDIQSGDVVPAERTSPFSGPYASAIIEGNWKIIKTIEGNEELYNLARDPNELQSIEKSNIVSPEERATVTNLYLLLSSQP